MKAIIQGTRYDTEKAVLIAETDNLGDGAESVTDFAYWQAGLYKTPRSGRYFLAGRGGPMSTFAKSVGRSGWSGGEGIIPFEDERAAFAWAQDALSGRSVWTNEKAAEAIPGAVGRTAEGADVIEHFFGHLIEDA